MMSTINIYSTTNILERHRRAIAGLAAVTCPDGTWPRAVLIVGASLEDALHPTRRVAVWWCAEGEADQLIGSALLKAYMHDDTPNIILARAYSDLQRIATALGRERAA